MPSKQAEHCIPDRWPCVTQLEHHRRERPVLLGAVVHQQVQTKGLFDKVAGGDVNSAIALAAARGIHKSTASGQLNEIGRGWSKSFMEHMGFVVEKDSLRRRQRSCPQIRRS